jgi:hypothetical protein
VTTLLVQFFDQKTGKPRRAAIVDIDVPEAVLRARAYSNARDESCPCCRNFELHRCAVERVHLLGLHPKGRNVRADIVDVSHDARVNDGLKNRVLKPGQFVRELAASSPSSSTKQ